MYLNLDFGDILVRLYLKITLKICCVSKMKINGDLFPHKNPYNLKKSFFFVVS